MISKMHSYVSLPVFKVYSIHIGDNLRFPKQYENTFYTMNNFNFSTSTKLTEALNIRLS